MKKTILSLAALLVIAVSLVSCTGGSPKANAQKFLDGLYHLDIASAKTVSTDSTKKQLDGYEQMMGFVQGSARDEMKKVKVDVKEPKVNGDMATVEYTLTNDPSVKTLQMVKEGGVWKAKWSKNDIMGGAMGGGMNGGAGMNGGGMNSGGSMGGSAPMDTTMAPGADQNMNGAPTSDTAKMNMK